MHPTEMFSVAIPFTSHSEPRRYVILNWIARWWDYQFSTAEVRIGMNEDLPMNRSAARNEAVKSVTSEYVIIADGDTFFDPEGIIAGLMALEDGASWVLPYGDHSYYNLNREFSDKVLDSPVSDTFPDLEFDHQLMSWAGAIMMRTADYWKVGGYDERFKGWGHEDVAFRVKADHELGPFVRVPGRAMHIWHTPAQFDTAEERANRILFNKEYKFRYKWQDERLRR